MTAAEILAANRYMTLATSDEDGRPWVSPVWFAYDGDELFWVSRPKRRHSHNIAARPEVSIVVFDSTVPVGGAQALYIDARAEQLEGAARDRALAVVSRRSVAHGAGIFAPADVEGDAALRLYRAVATEGWLRGEGDHRLPTELRPAG